MARAYLPGDPRARLNGRRGGQAAARTKRRRAFQRAVRSVGAPITRREAAVWSKGYASGYSAGQKTGEARGRRKAAA
jgi:hypothetical protein